MNRIEMDEKPDSSNGWRSTTMKYAFSGFALVAAFFLLTEHTAHVFGYLPYLLILACPLMHIFGHGGHGHGGHSGKDAAGDSGAHAGHGRKDLP